MSAPPAGSTAATGKVQDQTPQNDAPAKDVKAAAALEEDDEFEDFPVEDWTQDEAEPQGDNAHLWEESWDDDDTSEEFSAQLKEELKKVEAGKKN